MYFPAGFTIPIGLFIESNLFHLVGLWLMYLVIRSLYNISPLHPLSHIPGPKIAAATFLYEGWFDLILGGRYTHEIKRMHEFYGPVIRINPEELHFKDTAFVDEIYASGGRKRDKQVHFLNFVAGPITSSMFATVEHDHHRIRRSAMNKEPLNAVLSTTYLFRFFPSLKVLVDIAPLFAKWVRDDIAIMLAESNEKMPARIRKAKQAYNDGTNADRPSIFAAILGSSLPDAEKTDHRLGGEGFSMISAGTETTAWTLTVTTFYLLSHPETLARLSKELQDADAINLSWFALEKLPYLSAIITESLRLSYGVTARTPRIAPNENLIYRGQFHGRKIQFVIPSGTPMGMSTVINHHNEDVFPDSDKFMPERWLGLDEAQRRRMESNLTSFSKGSRQCLAMR
ncbi:hypothetical protein NHQ30_003094 [Ciborinia camelliae]|nr:hypothetical protein NHQ30_003094 [Ciborinia camelliae]